VTRQEQSGLAVFLVHAVRRPSTAIKAWRSSRREEVHNAVPPTEGGQGRGEARGTIFLTTTKGVGPRPRKEKSVGRANVGERPSNNSFLVVGGCVFGGCWAGGWGGVSGGVDGFWGGGEEKETQSSRLDKKYSWGRHGLKETMPKVVVNITI